MGVRKKNKQTMGKGKVKKCEKSQIMDQPALFPTFPFGLFLLPLIVPALPPVAKKDGR